MLMSKNVPRKISNKTFSDVHFDYSFGSWEIELRSWSWVATENFGTQLYVLYAKVFFVKLEKESSMASDKLKNWSFISKTVLRLTIAYFLIYFCDAMLFAFLYQKSSKQFHIAFFDYSLSFKKNEVLKLTLHGFSTSCRTVHYFRQTWCN